MSVEAAVLLPVALALVALLVQPACVLYTRSVMAATASELVRVAATSRGSGEGLRAFALRRLAAVPDVSLFHEGGPASWEVEVTGPDEEGVVMAAISGRVRLLPVLGVLASALGRVEGGALVVEVEVSGPARAAWVEGSYDAWIEMWG